jgi:hypothetical protein
MNIVKPKNEGIRVNSKTNMSQQRLNAYEFYCSDCLNKCYFALKRVFVFNDLLTTTSAQAVVRLARRIPIFLLSISNSRIQNSRIQNSLAWRRLKRPLERLHCPTSLS